MRVKRARDLDGAGGCDSAALADSEVTAKKKISKSQDRIPQTRVNLIGAREDGRPNLDRSLRPLRRGGGGAPRLAPVGSAQRAAAAEHPKPANFARIVEVQRLDRHDGSRHELRQGCTHTHG